MGYFFIALGLMQALDWVIRLYSGIRPLIGFGGVVTLFCGGNGFAFYCHPLAVLLYGAYGFAVISAPIVIGICRYNFRHNRFQTPMPMLDRLASLIFLMSLATATGFIWLSIYASKGPGWFISLRDTVGMDYIWLEVIDALFIPVVGYAGLYLLRIKVSPELQEKRD